MTLMGFDSLQSCRQVRRVGLTVKHMAFCSGCGVLDLGCGFGVCGGAADGDLIVVSADDDVLAAAVEDG